MRHKFNLLQMILCKSFSFLKNTNVYDGKRFVDQNLMLTRKFYQNRNFRNIDQKVLHVSKLM